MRTCRLAPFGSRCYPIANMRPIETSQVEFRDWLRSQSETDDKRCELLNGNIVREPPASWLHGVVGARLISLLDQHVRERHLGIVVDSSAGYELPTGDTVEPDISFIVTGRWKAGPTPRPNEFFRIVPTLVVEVQSPRTARRDRIAKRGIYEASGVDEYWIVDPESRCVDVLVLRDGRYQRPHSYRARVHSKVLPDLVISLADLFAIPR